MLHVLETQAPAVLGVVVLLLLILHSVPPQGIARLLDTAQTMSWLPFVRQSLVLACSGKAHSTQSYSTAQTSMMVVSCVMYAVPGLVWLHFGFFKLGCWMLLVAVCSSLADGLIRTAICRVVDRWVAICGIVGCVWCNATSGPNLVLALLAVLSAIWWLKQSRRVANCGDVQTYVWYHSMWHAHGAFVCAAVTWLVHSVNSPIGSGIVAQPYPAS